MADLAYILLRDEVDRRAHMQFLASATIAAAGGGNELTDPDAERAKFDAALTARPKEINPEQRVLMDALGVGRGHHR